MTVYQIAIPLPTDVKKTLHRICCGLPSVEWIDEEDLHLSLFNLGKIDGATLIDIKESLAKIEFSSFVLSVYGIGHSRSKGDRGSIWAGVSETPPLSQLRKEIQKCLKESDIKIENNKSATHITLANFSRSNPSRLAEYLSSYSMLYCPPFTVNAFVLLSARETPKRTIYTVEAVFSSH